MSSIMKLKHWQLFIILTFFFIVSIIVNLAGLTAGDLQTVQLSVVFRIIGTLIYFIWLLVLGISLNNKPDNPFNFSKPNFITAIVICILGYIELYMRRMFPGNPTLETISLFISPFTVLAILFVLYCVSRSLNSLAKKRKVKLRNYIGDIFLLIFFPVGVWILQPRINRLYKG